MPSRAVPILFVLTTRGERGPLDPQGIRDLLRSGEIRPGDQVRDIFGRMQGCVEEVISAAPRQVPLRTRSQATAESSRARTPHGSRTLVIILIGTGVLTAIIAVAVLLRGGNDTPSPVAPVPAPPQPEAVQVPKPPIPASPPVIPVPTKLAEPTAIRPLAALASSSQSGMSAESIIDGRGLSNDHGTWVHSNDKYAMGGTMWNTAYEPAGAAGQAWVTLDLGTVHQVSGLMIWNFNEKDYQHRGIKELEVQASADGKTFVPAGRFTLACASGNRGEPAQRLRLEEIKTRHLKLLARTNYSWEAPVGLSEVVVLVDDPQPNDRLLR